MSIDDNTSNYYGKLKIVGEIANFSATSNQDFIKKFIELVVSEFPEASQNVIYSNQAPKDADRNKVWFVRNNSGSFVGIRLYHKGSWKQIYPVDSDGTDGRAPTKEVKWVKGDSRQVPYGWKLIDDSSTTFNVSELSQLQGQYIVDGSGAYYTYFAIEFVGF
jgi:hypothetical protein